jgi:hypothetical protein
VGSRHDQGNRLGRRKRSERRDRADRGNEIKYGENGRYPMAFGVNRKATSTTSGPGKLLEDEQSGSKVGTVSSAWNRATAD